MHHGIHHFHGTPVWGSAGDVHRIAVSGAGAFVSYVRPNQIAASIQHAQVVGIDNGAFSAWVRGLKINWSDFYKWLLNYYHHPKVAFFVIPDVVDGGERDNDALINEVPKPAKKESTTVKRKRRTKKQKKEPEAKQGDYLVGTDENVLVLNRTYANRSNAERAAKMQWERLQRGVASFSLQLAEGRADLYTEMPVKVSGFKQPIDDAEWTITTLTHTVSPDNGFTTSLELEVKIDDFEME
ncbi:hypothetical protein WCU91_00035 [Escherichia coli]|uniref:hypothetical protein n=1 Tax=Escherichia coli TaxID=562 RepID=UPI00301C9363